MTSNQNNFKNPTWVSAKTFLIVSIIIVGIFISYMIYFMYFKTKPVPENQAAIVNAAVQTQLVTGAGEHVLTPSVELNGKPLPRSSGPHSPEYFPWGTFSEVPIDEDKAVHNLEHGGIVIYFKLDLPQAQKQELERLAKSGSFVIAAKENLAKPVVALSWGHSFELDKVDYELLRVFYESWKNQSPEKLA